MPEELRKGMTFVPVERVEQVWKTAMGLKLNGRRARRPQELAAAPAAEPAPEPAADPKAAKAASARQAHESPRACARAPGRKRTTRGGRAAPGAARPPLARHRSLAPDAPSASLPPTPLEIVAIGHNAPICR